MEGTLFPNRPTLPTQSTNPPKKPSNYPTKFNLSLPPPPPSPSQSLPLDSLLQHLTQENRTTPSHKNPTFPSLELALSSIHQEKTSPATLPRFRNGKEGFREGQQDPCLEFLSRKAMFFEMEEICSCCSILHPGCSCCDCSTGILPSHAEDQPTFQAH